MPTRRELELRIEQLERERDQARRANQEAQRLLRNTTLEEYLRACQEHLLANIVLNTDGYLTSKAPTTNPTRKHCPRRLAPWNDFVETQIALIEALDEIVPRDARLFENVNALATFGDRVHARPVRSEASLVFVQNNCVEDPVRIVLSRLKDFRGRERHGLDVRDGVYFETTASSLRDPTDGRDRAAQQRDARLRTDQICVFRVPEQEQEQHEEDKEEQEQAGGTSTTDMAPPPRRDIAYVIEYKAPHKLHTTHFEQGLRPMSIVDEVVNKPTIPTAAAGDPARFQHYAELLSTAAVTQTYHYMLEAGLAYGYLTNGDAIVFLKIDWATDPTVLFYHLAQPAREVVVDEDPAYSNAVCQVLVFTVLALQARQRGNDERVAATRRCATWEVDFGWILDRITEAEEKEKAAAEKAAAGGKAQTGRPTTPTGRKHRRVPSSPDWLPRPIKKTKRSPRRLEQQKEQRPDGGSDRVLRPRKRRDDDSEGSSGGGEGPGHGGGSGPGRHGGGGSGASGPTTSMPEGRSGQAPGGSSSRSMGGSTAVDSSTTGGGGSVRKEQRRPYCTPLCLLSLVKGRLLDTKCPNVAFHRDDDDGGGGDDDHTKAAEKTGRQLLPPKHHPVSHAQWTALLRAQLAQSLEKGVVVLGQEGACGALLQITLLRYGYTFVAKGVTGRAVPQLVQEEAAYERLQSLQGRHIPVCLGAVDLRELDQVLFYDIDVRIIRFLFLSYGGTRIKAAPDAATQTRMISTLAGVLDEMHRLGVVHGDVRLPNVLQGPTGQITLVDFDRAVVLPSSSSSSLSSARGALSAISPNKRRRLLEDEEDEAPSTVPDAAVRAKMRLDRANAQSLFTLDAGRILWGPR
ncbi:Protein kinase-like domain protein [Niveomyces insectorum RCEF 264]|uniref:Protein kinase-like domain protein n=1 Tax=Niveomyces insectorum RCEF 264 TaxID=1081102 RepID=A0A167VFZ3_9HYPO|nr:Protein kinase-like domain protein [Niveomyces insectorum RCEF 264]